MLRKVYFFIYADNCICLILNSGDVWQSLIILNLGELDHLTSFVKLLSYNGIILISEIRSSKVYKKIIFGFVLAVRDTNKLKWPQK